MEIDDRVTVTTPEGVDLELVVVGLGSRFMSSLVDTALQAALIIPLLVLAARLGGAGPAVASAGTLLVLFGVPTAFDAFAGGRTPGRRLAGLRLVTEEGATVGLVPAAVRNVVRIVDFLPAFYSIGVLAVLASGRNQRLGDLAAGTLVVRSRAVRRRAASTAVPGASRPAPAAPAEVLAVPAGWDLTAVSADDLAVVRSFLARRDQLDADARRRVAGELARRLAPVVVGPDPSVADEVLLEQVVAAKEARGR